MEEPLVKLFPTGDSKNTNCPVEDTPSKLYKSSSDIAGGRDASPL